MADIDKIKKRLSLIDPSFHILRIFSALCFSSIYFIISSGRIFDSISDYASVRMISVLAIVTAFYIILSVFALLIPKIKFDAIVFPIITAVYFIIMLTKRGQLGFALTLGIAAALAVSWYSSKNLINTDKIKIGKKTSAAVICAICIIFVCAVGYRTVMKCLIFETPNFDHGLFVHMFRNICKTFAPVTTCERDRLLSHFDVHMSPILYILTPIFKIFPADITLELCQVFILASSCIPALLICRTLMRSNARSCIFASAVMFLPALTLGTSYDFHENCFLTPLLLWVFCFYEKKKYIPMYIFAVLTLMVKEDAAVYIVFFALYCAFSSKKIIRPSAMAVVSTVYFLAVTYYLAKSGDGVMTNRYSNFVTNDSLFSMIKNIIASPGYVFTQLFTDSDGKFAPKVLFLINLTAPLAFLPFAVKKISRAVLLCPMILLNLMTMYKYQFDLGFQYCFGSVAFLIYIAALNVSEMKKKTADQMLITSLIISAMCFWAVNIPSAVTITNYYKENKNQYAVMREACESIPEDAGVICSTRLLAKLADRDTIYEIYYHEYDEKDGASYVVIDARYEDEEFIPEYESYGFEITDTVTADGKKLMVIMQKIE